MNPNPINEFLPASAGPRLKGDTGGEDDFDLARLHAIRKEQKDELERLDRRHHDQQAAIDNQIQLEHDRLFQHFQQGMQNFYASLRQTINTTIENQVNFRMQKERICEDHTTNKRDVEKRFHSEASRLVMSSTHAVRPSQPFPTVPSNVSRPAPLAASPPTNGDHHLISPPASSVANTPPIRQQVMPRPVHGDSIREFIIQEPRNHPDYMAPYPTPVEPAPKARKPVPSEPRHVEPRHVEPRHVEPHHVEPRHVESRPLESRQVESRQVEARQVEARQVQPRQVEQRQVEARQVQPRQVEQRQVEQRQVEQRQVEQRQVEQRQVEQRQVEQRQVEQHQVEQRQVQPRQVEQRQVEQRQVEQHQVETRQVETRQGQPRQVESRQGEFGQAEARQAEARQAEARQAEARQAEAEARQAEARQAEPRKVEPRSIEPRPIEPRQIEPRPVETRPVQPIAARQIYVEPKPMEPQAPSSVLPSQQASHFSEPSIAAFSRPDSKRKALESMTTDDASRVPHPKRPRTREKMGDEAQGAMSSPSKRSPRARRSSHHAIPMGARIDRTITFDEVYQNGKAQYKHKIFEWKTGSGMWYIVRCDEHQVHFGFNNPVHGAAKHVHSPQHGNLEKRHDLAIRICGHRVVGCTAEMADLNNREFDRAMKEDNYIVFNMNLLSKEGRRRLTDGTEILAQTSGETPVKKSKLSTSSKSTSGVKLPHECKFYQGLWAPTKKWYMLIVLPIRSGGDLREVGLKEKLQETQLMSKVPKCYRVDRISLLIKGWQSAYEDGGPKVEKREYPVMFFDGHQKHSLGWLTARKLREVDLDNPPEDVDKRGLATAREWYSVHMMHRQSWADFKNLGPGEPTSATASDQDSGRGGQWPSLRSANTDNQSPIQDRPGQFGFGSSSEDGSDDDDDEDPMSMDIGPIPEPQDSNYVAESGSEGDDSDVEMGYAGRKEDSDQEDVIHTGRKASATIEAEPFSSRLGSRRGLVNQTTSANGDIAKKNTHATEMGDAEMGEPIHEVVDTLGGRPASSNPTPASNETGDRRGASWAVSDKEDLRKSTQAKAVAACQEAASLRRTPSEVPDGVPSAPKDHTSVSQQSTHGASAPQTYSSRPPFEEHHRSKSDGAPTNETTTASHPSGTRNSSDLHKILNANHGSTQAASKEYRVDPYQQFEAIKAQVAKDGLKNRATSAPVCEGESTAAPFRPPPSQQVNQATHNSASLFHILSPPSQSPTMIPRSLSTTPVQGPESGRSTPKIVIPGAGNSDKWQAVRAARSFPAASPPQQQKQLQNPRASFVGMPSVMPSQEANGHVDAAAKSRAENVREVWTPTPQLGTPIPDKEESFELTQFRDSARGVRWSREGPAAPFLRLVTDPMRGWAETAGKSPLKAAVEPGKVTRIDLEGGDDHMQKVKLTLKDGTEQELVFETKSTGGRVQAAALQRRRFASWVKKMNRAVEYRSSGVHSRSSSVADDRRSSKVE